MEKTEQVPDRKKPYRKPTINVYGRIAELTRGGAGTSPDGNMVTRMN